MKKSSYIFREVSILLIILMLLLTLACQKTSTDSSLGAAEKAQIIAEVEQAVWEFYAADTSRNAEKVMALLWSDCNLLIDGNRVGYAEISKGVKEFMESLRLFHAEWTDLQVVPVAENAALASYIFRDSIIDKSGKLTQSWGPNTFLWQKRQGEWRVIYVDADHYPVNEN